jgi:hypothetical protein
MFVRAMRLRKLKRPVDGFVARIRSKLVGRERADERSQCLVDVPRRRSSIAEYQRDVRFEELLLWWRGVLGLSSNN